MKKMTAKVMAAKPPKTPPTIGPALVLCPDGVLVVGLKAGVVAASGSRQTESFACCIIIRV